jgi:CO dehydrogenase nickel-insertion accessory protein CooC1
MNEHPLWGLRFGAFGKGGAGKSTLVVLLARALRSRGYSVLVLDADSTNTGLSQALGIEREPDPLLDYFGGMVFSGGAVTCPVDDPTPLTGASLALASLPDRFKSTSPDGVRLLVAGKIGLLGPGAGCDGPVAKIARDLRITDLEPPHVVLADFKAGFEDPARGVLTSIDWALVVTDPTLAGLTLAVHLERMVAQIHGGVPPATRHLERADLVRMAVRQFREARIRGVLAVLNRVPDQRTEEYLRRMLGRGGPRIVGVLPEDPSIQHQWLGGERISSDRLNGAVAELITALEIATPQADAPAHR